MIERRRIGGSGLKYTGAPFGLALRSNGQLYVGETLDGHISYIDKYTQEELGRKSGLQQYIFDIFIDEVNGFWYYCAPLDNMIYKVDLTTNIVVDNIPTATAYVAGFTIDIPTNRLFVCNQSGVNSFVYDLTTKALIGTFLGTNNSQRVVLDLARNRVIICDLDGFIKVYNATTYQFISQQGGGIQYRGMVADYINNKLYVSDTYTGNLYVLDLITLIGITTIPYKPSIYGMAVDNQMGVLHHTAPNSIEQMALII